MASGRIDFISEYCDRWCERCGFTERCSAFAFEVAVSMCDGDEDAAFELALGRPKSVTPGDDQPPSWLAQLLNVEPTEAEVDEMGRLEGARRQRVKETPLSTLAVAVRTLSLEWLKARGAEYETHPAGMIREAMQIINRDVWLIGAKIHRALMGRDSSAHGEWFEDDHRQNDWNGSAKIALISIERSIVAWRTVADAVGDVDAGGVSDSLEALKVELEATFPDALLFRRPGFDD